MKPLRPVALAAACALTLVAPSRGGGALAYDTAGAPVVWDVASPVPYTLDAGGLGTLDAAAAQALVGEMFQVWTDVPTATIDFAKAGTLDDAEDVNGTNYGPYLGPYGGFFTPRGQNVIVFDADGAIFDDLFGVGSGVLGFAGPVFFSDGTTTVPVGSPVPAGAHIIEGLSFLNGRWIDGDPDNGELPLDMFKAVFVHEFGHFSGLDHTQVHCDSGELQLASGFFQFGPTETMCPFIASAQQAIPTFDDRTALSLLYPAADFAATTGCLSGTVFDTVGQPVSGANVFAYREDQGKDLSAVSGPSGLAADAGHYRLCGLPPGQPYRIQVQEIDGANSGGSSVGPFDPPRTLPGPPEGWTAPYESTDPALDDPYAVTVVTPVAGTDLGGHDIHLNEQRFAVLNWPWGYLSTPSDFINSPASFALANFDADQKPDMVSVQTGFDPGNVVRFSKGLGNGLFDPPASIDAFPGNIALASGQFNSGVDAHLDFAVASGSLGEVRLYLGNGDGTFAQSTLVPGVSPGSYQAALVTCDVDGNAYPDLVFLLRASVEDELHVTSLLGSADGTFSTVASTIPAAAGLLYFDDESVACGQFAGSPSNDLLFPLGYPPRLGLLTGDGAGGFTGSTIPVPSITARIGNALVAADFNRDGHLDVAVSDLSFNFFYSDIHMLLGDGAGSFTYAFRYTVAESFQTGMLAGDFDRDGLVDIASVGASGPGRPGAKLYIAYGDGAGGIRPDPPRPFGFEVLPIWGLAEFPVTVWPGMLQSADLDGDGRLDLVLSDTGEFGAPRLPAMTTLLARDLPFNRARQFFTVTPCRAVDTRSGAPLAAGVERTFAAAGTCGVPASAKSVAVNVTVVGATGDGHLTLYPGPLGPAPLASTINFEADRTRANNAVLALSPVGDGTFRVLPAVSGAGTVHFVVDVTGYFE